MTRTTDRLFINTGPPDIPEVRTAFAWLVNRIADTPSRRGLLVVHSKSNFEGRIESVIGSTVVKQLSKGGSAQFSNGVIELMTARKQRYSWPGPVLVMYPDQKLLDAVDSLIGVSEILVVPWIRDEIQPWIETWGAREFGTSAEQAPKQVSNPTVRAALQSLTTRVNVNTGLAHPSDRAAAIELFQLLRAAREPFNPAEVRAWLISSLRWKPQHADSVAEIAQRVLEGGRFNSRTHSSWGDDAVQRWRAIAARDTDDQA